MTATVQITCARCGANDTRPARGRGSPFCYQCSHARIFESQVAHGKVAFEIRKGRLARPSAYACVDCSAPAQQYDHRDYAAPLVVEPVCKSCNYKRGPALDSRCRSIPPRQEA